MTHKVFISYDHSEDRHYKELLNAWHNHPNFEFEFDNRSPLVAINSVDASVRHYVAPAQNIFSL